MSFPQSTARQTKYDLYAEACLEDIPKVTNNILQLIKTKVTSLEKPLITIV